MDSKSLMSQVLNPPSPNDSGTQRKSTVSLTHSDSHPIPFDIAGGSVRGQHHEKGGSNNQDAFAWRYTDGTVIAVVCDGCGSSKNSEVGAKLGARLTVEALRIWLPVMHDTPAEVALEQVRLHLLSQFGELVKTMGDNPLKTILNYFLFTIVGTVITPQRVVVFTHGDGVLAINDDYTNITYADNAPPYLAYDLVRDALDPAIHEHLTFRVHWEGHPDEVRHLLIGSDGVDDLHLAAEQCLPGKSTLVGPLAQFWREDRYFTNGRNIRRHLKRVNRTVTQCDREQHDIRKERGLLPDDTTFIVMRRKPDRHQEA